PGAGVPGRGAGLERRSVRLAGSALAAAGGLRDHVDRGFVLVGPAGAEALHLRVDDARIDGAHRVVAEPEPLNGAWREIFHHDIGALRHVLNELEPGLGFQVDGDGFLVGVEQQEIPGVLVLALARAGLSAHQGAASFAALRVFHLDDLGTEPSERFGAGWASLELGQVQNTDALKAARSRAVGSHFLVPPWSALRGIVALMELAINRPVSSSSISIARGGLPVGT